MEWLSSNWIWLALAGGSIAFFAFGRGGCGMGHGGHDHRGRGEGDQYDPRRETTAVPLSTPVARVGADDKAPPSTSQVHGALSADQSALAAEHAGHNGSPSQAGRQRHRHGC